MSAADFDDVEALWKASPGVGLYPGDDREGIERFLERNPGLSFVAREDGRMVGAVLCGHDGRRGYVTHLAVDDAHRGEGIGRRLVESALSALASAGIEKAHLFVFQENEGAREFWKRVGWRERGDLVTMSRYLTRRPKGEPEEP
ncbi:MAG: GNAT family N-acetyltransferase [Candidatus Eisenbacteria bacterium]|nr:GNAT family N-acetyltransferase [Candidatus Eisenbacteria bacterium]